MPSAAMHTAPLAEPGSLRPSPVSAVTVAVKLSALGLLGPSLTYPGQDFADVAAVVGTPMVVLPPDSQGMVPPVARSRATNDDEPPPVLPPVQSLTVRLPEIFPEAAVHVIELPV